MSDTDLHVALMEAGRMNLMHLPPGAIAWLWDRPTAQIDAAEALAVAANAYGNPIADASLLKADQNVLLIKCEGGECFRIYPDGGYSYDDAPMDIGGCSSVLQKGGCDPCEMDDNGHMADPSPGDGYNDAMDVATERAGNPEHLNDVDPHGEVQRVAGLTNLSGEPAQDTKIFDGVGDNDGVGAGMGTGSPYVGDVGNASLQLDNQMQSRELGEFRVKDMGEEELMILAESLGL